jgi:hypothetical protein
MVEYKCYRCGYTASQKINLKHHLNRKNICKPILEDISIEKMYEIYNFQNDTKQHLNSTQIAPKQHPNDTFEFQKIAPKQHLNDTLTAPKQHLLAPKKNMCQFCEKSFTRKTGLTKHLKCCKQKKIFENEKDEKMKEKNNEIQELKEMVEKLLIENRSTNITNNTTHNNNTTNNIININNYGDEDTKYITSDYIVKLLKNRPAKTIPELIKYTHFNDEHPENQNIKITNKKEPYIKVRKNDKWELQDKEETITDLIDRQQVHLMDEKIEKKIAINCNSSEKINIERCTDLYNQDDKDYMKRLYNESELIIINNSS